MKQLMKTVAIAFTLTTAICAAAAAQTSIEERNAQLKERINQNTITCTAEAPKKHKQASSYLCQFFAVSDAEYVNKDLEVSFQIAGENDVMNSKCKPTVLVTVKNRTNRVIYIDLANSFVVRGEDSKPYYVPSETTNFSGERKEVKQNQGAITDALGIGGALGKLAHGTDVKKDKINTTTTTTFAQRVVAIPPRQSKKLDEVRIFSSVNDNGAVKHTETDGYDYLAAKMDVGESLEWNEENSPVQWGAFVTYAFSEDLSKEGDTVGGMVYLKKAWGLSTPFFSFADYTKWIDKNFSGSQDGQLLLPLSSTALPTRLLQTWDGTLNVEVPVREK